MSTSVGQQLREARQAKNQSLEQVSRVTHIRPRYLEALEAGNLEALPSRTQARGFLRTYALHLQLDPQPLVERLEVDPTAATGTEAPEPVQAAASEDNYLEIADILRIQRETLGLSLDEAEKQTRVRGRYLEAFERGALGDLPSPVHARGMLKNYAVFLGLDPEPLMLKFAEGLQVELHERRLAQKSTRGRTPRSPLRRVVSNDLLLGSAFLVGLILFVIWAVGRVSAVQASQTAVETAPALVEVLDPGETGTPAPSPSPTPDPLDAAEATNGNGGAATPVPTQPVTNDAPIQVYIVVVERAWMRVTVDGQIEFEGRVIPGSAYPFSGREEINVLTSSGSALEVIYNQQSLGPMGLFGQIVERIYTADAVLAPTPAESPTPMPTETLDATETPEGTAPPVASPTPEG
ncbi:MAG TPA: RodZ domain-containing protein [Anaerolineales bacterium]|nr:RodZ domain-containing protein [Anaerolineales bacterium]